MLLNLAQAVAAMGSVTFRNGTINGTNNTSGGLIVLVNNESHDHNQAEMTSQGKKTFRIHQILEPC